MTNKMLVELLHFYILENPAIEDVYFIETKGQHTCEPELLVGVKMRQDALYACRHMVLLSKDRHLQFIKMKLWGMHDAFGEHVNRTTLKELGIDPYAVNNVWLMSQAKDKTTVENALAEAVFNNKERKGCEVYALGLNDVALVPNETVEELMIRADLACRGKANAK